MGPLGYQDFQIIDKGQDGKIHIKKLEGVAFVPLTDREKQWPGDQ